MEADPLYQRFRATHARLYVRLNALRAAVEAWLEAHASLEPTLADLAHLEGLHAERLQLRQELQQAEDSFIEHVLTLRKPPA
jgi:hypothetical protein